jgi:glycosyltransferase involved in cell wall biosynthesis
MGFLTKDMKIAFVLNHFLPIHIAGTEIYTWALCKELIEKNIEVVVIIPNFNSEPVQEYYFEEIKVINFPANVNQDKQTIMGFKKPEGLSDFKNILEKCNPDIVHFHEYSRGSGIGIEHLKIAKKLNKEIVSTFHISEYSCQTNELIYKARKLCDGLIKINKCSKCYLHKRKIENLSFILIPLSNILHFLRIDSRLWNNKIGTALGTTQIIRNLKSDLFQAVSLSSKIIVLTEWYYSILKNNKIPEDKLLLIKQGLPVRSIIKNYDNIKNKKLKLIFIGRISKEKGLHILIDALSKINENSIELDIFGQSTDFEYEMELKKKSKRFSNIKWNGILQKDMVLNTLIKYDALCLCSTFSEMSPLVIQEAFSVGVPVIASNVYGNSEQIKNGKNGLLFEFNNSNSLKEKLNQCILNRNLILELKQNITKPKSFEIVGEEHIKLYLGLLNKN